MRSTAQRDRLGPLRCRDRARLAAAVRRAAGVAAASEADAAGRRPSTGPPRPRVRRRAAARPKRTARPRCRPARAAHARLARAAARAPRAAQWATGPAACCKNDGEPRTQMLRQQERSPTRYPDIQHAIAAEQDPGHGRRRSAAARCRWPTPPPRLLLLAAPDARRLCRRARASSGYLDYTDLIGRTTGLLRDPGAAWVLYKLDGGIDHLLLDEVQDTAPEQWQIAHRLTEEFFAGLGARSEDGAPARTFFAVGDPKQSIYSFQGADPDRVRPLARRRWPTRVGKAGQDMARRHPRRVVPLDPRPCSPWSTPCSPTARGRGRRGRRGKPLQHFADRRGRRRPGRAMAAGAGAGQATPAALDRAGREPDGPSGPQRLADGDRHLDRGRARAARPAVSSRKGRPLEAGDILVLVQRADRDPAPDRPRAEGARRAGGRARPARC